MLTSRQFIGVALAAFAFAAIGGNTLRAQTTFTWNTGNGLFNFASNWTPAGGPPSTLDTAQFTSATAYTVTFTTSPLSATAIVGNGTVTWISSGPTNNYGFVTAATSLQINGGTLNLGGATAINVTGAGVANVVLGGKINIVSGSTLSVTRFNLVNTSSATTSTVDGVGSSLTTTSTTGVNDFSKGIVNVQNSATATFNASWSLANQSGSGGVVAANVLSGASVTAVRNLLVGGGVGQTSASLLIDGAGSQVISSTTTGSLFVGGVAGTATGTITVQNGGLFDTSDTLSTVGQTGQVTLKSGSTFKLDGDLTVTGGGFSNDGNLNIAAGKTINVQSGAQFLNTSAVGLNSANVLNVTGAGSKFKVSVSTLAVNGGSLINVSSGGSLDPFVSNVSVGTSGAGTIVIDGTGSTLKSSDSFAVGANGFSGTLTVQNSANGVVNLLALGDSAVANSNGVCNIQSGATALLDHLSIATQSGANVGGTLNITGAGTAVSLFGSLGNSVIGAASGSTANVNVNSGAAVTLDGGTLTINRTGTVTIAGASFAQTVATAINVSGTLNAATATSFTLASGSTLNVNNQGVVNLGVYSTAASQQYNVNFGGLFSLTTLNHNAGNIALNGGEIRADAIAFGGGVFNWNVGKVHFNGAATIDNSFAVNLLGSGLSVSAGRTLQVDGVASLGTALNLNGGVFSAGSIADATPINFTAGTFNLTNSPLTVGTGGQFGSTLNLDSSKTINVSQSTTVIAGGLLRLAGGGFSSTGGITNNGTIQLASDVSSLTGGVIANSGTIRGTGFIGNTLSNGTSGQVQLTAGNRLEFGGGGNTNAGIINMVGGELQFNGSLTNSANTGLISGRDAILRFNGGLTNNQSLAFSNGTMDAYGNIASTRYVSASDRSRITVSGGGTANFYGDVTVANGQTDIQVSAAGATISKAIFFGTYNGGSTGGGQVFIEGDHRPGASPGFAHFAGDAYYGGASTLHMEIGGLTRGIQYDSIDVSNILGLNGTLDVDLINGFVPTVGQQFTVATYAAHQGDFAAFKDLVYQFGRFVPQYIGNSLVLRFVPSFVGDPLYNGDFDGNGFGGGDGFGGNFGPVPEPSHILMACGLVGTCIYGIRQRTRIGRIRFKEAG